MSPFAAPSPLAVLWQRLLARDPNAWPELCKTLLEPLTDWLRRRVPYADPDLAAEAAEDALIGLAKRPHSYDPRRGGLEAYLRLSARGDLLNLERRERRHRQGRCDLLRVALDPQAGKYLGVEDDPCDRLILAEEEERLRRAPPGLGGDERRVWELMCRGERRTPVYAEMLGLSHLPPKEQRHEVKRWKDRIRKRCERSGGET